MKTLKNGLKNMNAKNKAMLSSYLRSAIAAVLAVVSTGNYSPEDLAKAGLAALLRSEPVF